MRRTGIAAGLGLLALALAAPAAARTVAFETDQVTEAAVAIAPDGSTLVFTLLGHLFRMPVAGSSKAEQVTFGPSYDGDPAFSPDGSRIVFISDRAAGEGDELALFLLDPATKEVRRLTHEPFAIRPTFTAGGDAIVYLATPPQPGPPGSLILRRVPLSGGAAETLSERPALYRSLFRLADGRIAWSVVEMKPGSFAAGTRIEALGADGKVAVLATCDGLLERIEASPAGDGVYARRTQPQGGDLVFVPTGAGAGPLRSVAPVETRMGPRPRIAVGAAGVFLGDAGRLVKIDGTSGAREALPMRAHVTLEIEDPVVRAESAERPAGPRPRAIVSPILMRDGGLIFEAAGHLWMQPGGGEPARRIEEAAAGSASFEAGPALSPDGTKLAYVRSEGTRTELRVLDLATRNGKAVATGGGYAQPAWSADGSSLVFVEWAGFAASIVSVAIEGGERAEIGAAGFWTARPNYAPDGRWLYTTSNDTGVGNVVRQEAGGSAEPVTRFTRHASEGLVSPDGRWLAFRRNKTIWIAALPSGETKTPLGDADARRIADEGGDGFSFAPDSKAVVYAAGGRVYRQPIAGGARVEIPVRLDLPHPRPKPLLIRNVRLLDFETGGFGAPTSLAVDAGRIAWIGAETGRKLPRDVAILDAAGKFAIPGLFEMHAHTGGANPEAFIAYGVTSVRDTGGTIVGAHEVADRADATGDPVPRSFFSGEIFEGTQPYWGDGFLQIRDEAEARDYVRRFKAAGASFIKVYPSLPWPLQLAVVDEARRAKLPVVGHGMSVNEITRSVTQGFASIEHTMFPQRIYDDVIRMLAASQTRWDPTLAVVGGDSQLLRKEPDRLADPKLLAFTPPSAIVTAKAGGYEKDMPDDDLSRAWQAQLASVREARARGVKLAAGTDAPNPACFYGASLHWELEFFAAAGVPAIDVLRLATAEAAKTVGAKDLGAIAPGMLADLVLLDASPLDDIRNTQAIWRTVKGGWVYDPSALRPPP